MRRRVFIRGGRHQASRDRLREEKVATVASAIPPIGHAQICRGIRPATVEDASDIARIYAPIVADTAISFETVPPAVEEMARRIDRVSASYAWLVSLDPNGRVDGYAYGSLHRTRAAYRWSTETSVYVRSDRRRLGVGRDLYLALLPSLVAAGFCQAFAGITLPNGPSIRLHEALGFREVGTYRKVGFKLGAWRDVGWWQFELNTANPPPERPWRVADD